MTRAGNRAGFTLIELIVVMLVLSAVAAVTVPAFLNVPVPLIGVAPAALMLKTPAAWLLNEAVPPIVKPFALTSGVKVTVPALFQAPELSCASPGRRSIMAMRRCGCSSFRNTASVVLMMPAPTRTTSALMTSLS